ncbi:helix-turn-helix domain-containing protein [Bacillus sp. WLY-B-L8]|uniref:helix-turn-helix domain-containing protein n=1 Tax=Bacillus multifaciens TaxID=3068506 RepID=UPI002741B2CF|nr:helix-turn-helix domain-containing protein [Bacillus sp. WLY-B-L8]MDP7978363.1 helix-turn-helix domain-containing protein [Bacillus sp. WLY-B-L8]
MHNFICSLIDDKAIKRQIAILESLNNEKKFVSSQKLADQLQCSTRTIRNDISQLRKQLPENWGIISVKTRGYILIKPVEESVLSVIDSYLTESTLYRVMLEIFHNKYYTLEKWSQILYMNKLTLRTHLKDYNKMLNKSGLNIKFRDLQLEGDEINIRYYYIAFFYFTQQFSDQPFIPIELRKKVLAILYHSEVPMDILLLRSIVFVFINRFFNRHCVSKEITCMPIYSDKQLKCLNEIITEIENYYKIDFSKYERDALHLFLFFGLINTGSQGKVTIEYVREYNQEIYKKFMNFIDTLLIGNPLSSELKGKLTVEVIPYFYKVCISRELNFSISHIFDPIHCSDSILLRNYKENVSLISRWNETNNDKQFTKDEIKYIASHATAILNSICNEINIVLVLSGTTVEKNLIYRKLKQSLGENVNIDRIPNYNMKYDFIISNCQLSDTRAPVIYISYMLTANEIDSIKNRIFDLD